MNSRRQAEALLSAARAGPEFLTLLVLVAVGAVWATRTGTIPGQGFPLIGPGIGGLLWGCLYVGLGLAYCIAAPEETGSPRNLWRKLGLCLALALISTHVCELLVSSLLGPAAWAKLFYLRRLLPPAFVALWATALLPRQTRALVGAATTNRILVPLPQLALLVFAAAVLVSSADLVFEAGGSSAVEGFLKSQVIRKNAWATNILMLFSAYGFIFAITGRLAATMLLVSPAYATLVLASVAKIKYMHAAIQPLDLIRIPEFVPLFPGFFGTTAVVAAVTALGLWIGALLLALRIQPCRMPSVRRWAVMVIPLTIMLALSFPLSAVSSPSISRELRRLGMTGWEFRERARESGFLLAFLSEVREAFVSIPLNYSPEAVENALSKYWAPPSDKPLGSHRVNLIIYLVESLMDPNDLGLHYTSDPIPTIRALRRFFPGGYAIVPEEFGGSANTEFEVLTGMAMCFLPRWSLPYRQYLRRPIPSLPTLLRRLGYTATAVQPDPKYFFNRERAYRLLAFDNVIWLDNLPGVERAAGNNWPSDNAVVDAVIRATQQSEPAFIFAFPASTHSPYSQGTYRNSDLGVIDPPASDTLGEVKEYINALRIADRAIGRLIEYYGRQPDSTIIAIVGDHLPPLSESAVQPYFARMSKMSKSDQFRMRRRVPLAVWSNFELPKEEKEFSASALPSYLLAKMRIPNSYLFAVADAVRLKLPVLPGDLRDCGVASDDRDGLSREQRELLTDYRLLQYDLLLGKQYAFSDSSSDSASGPKTSSAAERAKSPTLRHESGSMGRNRRTPGE